MSAVPKRRRLLNTLSHSGKYKNKGFIKEEPRDVEAWSARGRFKGALLHVMEPAGEDTDSSLELSPKKEKDGRPDRPGHVKRDLNSELDAADEDNRGQDKNSHRRESPPRQSYVMKLFDRSVDLAQFKEDSPLYPICRAWMANQPKTIYSQASCSESSEEQQEKEDEKEVRLVLPGPQGPRVSRIPALLHQQTNRNKDIINLNYKESPPPSRELLLHQHIARWNSIRLSWQEQATRYEARYANTQAILNSININSTWSGLLLFMGAITSERH